MPVLLMEQLESNLHAYLLHPDNANLPMEVKISILYDTANGLKYLHERTPTIIHRDLTAKNVLLLHLEHSKLRAKLADFGNARIVDLDPESSPEQLSSIPGTLEYMPPEAHGEKVTYGPSLDVFSFGHLALFTITQTLVRPLPPTYYDTSTGEIHGRSEVKRRANFDEAEQLSSVNSSIVKLIKQCLHNFPAQRPHTGELLTKLQKMMDPVEETDKSLEKRTSVAGRDTDCKPHLTNLMRLPVLTGDIKIMEESAVKYSDIGTILLKDDHGVRVDTVTEASKGDPVKAIRMIYARWIREDVDCSWLKLTQCLKDCDLNSLANRIEQHFGLSSPQLSPKVLSDVTLHTYDSREQDITSPSKARGNNYGLVGLGMLMGMTKLISPTNRVMFDISMNNVLSIVM
jgi:serine/threonine protein kinase